MTDVDLSVKACKVCGEQKQLALFPSVKGGKYRGATCNACVFKRRSDREANDPSAKSKTAARVKAYKARLTTEQRRAAKVKDSQRRAEQAGYEYKSSADRKAEADARRALERAAYDANGGKSDAWIAWEQMSAAERQAQAEHKPWLAPGLTDTEAWTIRYQVDRDFRRRNATRRIIKRIRMHFQSGRCAAKLEAFLGYTMDAFKDHMISLMTEGMTWELFLAGEIHCDHRIAVKYANHDDPQEVRAIWQLDNLQPLWPIDNMKKGAKLPEGFETAAEGINLLRANE